MKRKIFVLLMLMMFISCKKHDMMGTLQVNFTFSWSGHNNTAANLNATVDSSDEYRFDGIHSGNLVNLSSVQFFVSAISLYNTNGSVFITDESMPHYVDLSVSSTLSWTSPRFIPAGVYDSIIFYFGLLPADNVSGRFMNPPESNMFWPGSGYHFMMINGRWKNSDDVQFNTFKLHIGGGNMEAVRLSFPQRIFLTEESVISKDFDMALDKWFNATPVWDFNVYGGDIMQDTVAQRMLIDTDRVKSVFSVKN
jgi:hypothetical protein